MEKFIISLSNSHGHVYMLCAEVEEKEIKAIKKKITKNLVIKDTYPYSCNGHDYPAKYPKILQQLKKITGYNFVAFKPDLILNYGEESFSLPGYVGR